MIDHKFNSKYLYKKEILYAKIRVSEVGHGQMLLDYADDTDAWSDRDMIVFVLFCRLRNFLLEKDKILLCKGCMLNVHPLPFQIMGINGLVLTMGKQIDREKDAVCLFDEELEIDKIVSVEEQHKFYKEWWKSVMGTSI